MTARSKAAGNKRLAQWGLTSFIVSLCFYCKFVQANNLDFQNLPMRQAWENQLQPQEQDIKKIG